jgi:hypothetical protein
LSVDTLIEPGQLAVRVTSANQHDRKQCTHAAFFPQVQGVCRSVREQATQGAKPVIDRSRRGRDGLGHEREAAVSAMQSTMFRPASSRY